MRAWRMAIVLVLCLVIVVSCGPAPAAQSQLIETAAQVMNLTEADLGSAYALQTEEGLDGLKSDWDLPNDKDLKDASFRMFESENGMLMAVVVTLNKPATGEELQGLTSGFEEGFSQELPGVELKQMEAPSVGDQATLTGAEIEDLGVGLYFLGFRKANVVGIIALVGLGGTASESDAVALAQKMQAKIK